jgi:hypothetical protein
MRRPYDSLGRGIIRDVFGSDHQAIGGTPQHPIQCDQL